MPENTFDIVSKIDLAEVNNAVQQALKEIHQRFDLKDSKSDIQLNEKDNKLVLASLDDYKLKAVSDVLQQKLVKRNVSLKGLTFGPIMPAAGSSVRQEITLQQGISTEKAREIVKLVKDSKKKVQASIQGDVVRIAGKDRDSLQDVIAMLRGPVSPGWGVASGTVASITTSTMMRTARIAGGALAAPPAAPRRAVS